ILAGVVILNHPLWAGVLVAGTLLLVLGFLGIALGAIDIFRSISERSWGGLVVGIVSIFLGLFLVFEPLVATSIFLTLLGLLAAIGGVAAVAAGLMQRRYQKHVETPEGTTSGRTA